MNNNTEVVFENIEQRILKEIEEAHYAIFVSVAWFTNKRLFKALLEKARSNCYVSIIIQLDEINSQSGINYEEIKIGRSECFTISKDTELLHDKFCVIDFKKVITGSYNWTYKASHNSENVIVLNDPSVATQYITRFEQQKAKFVEPSSQQKPMSPNVSNSVSETPRKIEVIKPIVSVVPIRPQKPSKPKCSYCGKEIENNDTFCRFCGKQQKGAKFEVVVTCNKCNRKQEAAFVDATRTNYCTFCGSSNLTFERIEKQYGK